jgi:protein-S-isoprenylcysteine O-methyltransferase Ste14
LEPVAKAGYFCNSLIGLIIFFLALISLGKAWRIEIDEDNTNELITTGIMLIYPNIIFMATAICTIAGIHLQVFLNNMPPPVPGLRNALY